MRAFPRLLIVAASLSALMLARPVLAAGTVDDLDEDGVADDVDACLDTPAGDLVDPEGCSVCPCEGPSDEQAWSSRQEYQLCVSGEVRSRKRSGAMSRKDARAAIKNARKASCGDVALTRCCIYPSDQDDAETIVGQCKITTVDKCDQLSEQLDWAEDADPGSCLPNPCIF